MKFFYEQTMEDLISSERHLKRLKEQLVSPPKQSEVLWECAEYVESVVENCWIWWRNNGKGIQVYLNEQLDKDVYFTVIDVIEKICEEYGYEMKHDKCSSYENEHNYIFENGFDSLNIYFTSGTCKKVKTGKFLEEEVQVCGFFKE